ncbi:transmembrane protein 120 homolog [Chrysoperla carnea]|uniref:transmembrane protein 120 homolog n=1 Tax=Chrysoperla carnea TaxID=189513 RepID=UPI001D06DD70|nr:transmembrane protein 120 homolog [Chrysoperla carnea]
MDPPDIESVLKDWEDLSVEYKDLEILNRQYQEKLEEISELQEKCLKGISHQKYRIGIIKQASKKLRKGLDKELVERLDTVEKEEEQRLAQLYEMEQILPKQNGRYLKIILGNVNVSILNKNDKFKYKDEYEKFKLVLSGIGFLMSVLNLILNYRAVELAFIFLLVWYYCTLTIRESILKVNGSRIKGWWRLHHFISTAAAGILLIWPDTTAWQLFRTQFMWFNAYISFVQYLQFVYQQGVLYRLKALGERHNMDITIEGFHSWMWRGLSFLLPTLFIGYFFQLYNAYTLYKLSYHPTATWHVPVLAVMFFIIFWGNIRTTGIVVFQKLDSKDRAKLQYRVMGQRDSSASKNQEEKPKKTN